MGCMPIDKDTRERAESALELLEEDGWSVKDYDVEPTGENGVKLSIDVYTYE